MVAARLESARPAPPARASPPRISGLELAGYVALMLATATTRVVLAGGPQFFNDSYQYLSVAENLRDRGSLSTSLVHFDTERRSGRVPAPATTFPPGYPLAIGALSWTRLPLEWIALALSLGATITVLPLLRAAAFRVGLGRGATRACLILWASSAQVALYATLISSEALFTATTLGAFVLLLGVEGAPRRRRGLPLAWLALAASCWLRYAGLLLVAACHAIAAPRIWREREGRGAWILSVLLCDVGVGALLARNIVLAGTWKGGNEREVRHRLGYVAHRLGDAAYELALGSIRVPLSLVDRILASLVIAGVLLGSAAAVRAWRGAGRSANPTLARAGPLLWCVGVYFAGMCYLGLTTHISLGGRMFVPMLPEVLLLAGLALSRAWQSAAVSRASLGLAGGLLAAGYLGGNLVALAGRPPVPAHRIVAEAMAIPTRRGVPLSAWLEASVPPESVLFAVDGQATGYTLRRKAVSAIGREYTHVVWDEEDVRRTMLRFEAEVLIVYPEVVSGGGVDQLDSEFLRQLARGSPPPWLDLAAENPRVLVYRSRSRRSLPAPP